MHYVYLLHSEKHKRFYIGESADIKQRLYQHNQGLTTSTKPFVPWQIIYYEAYPTKALALERERKLKHYGRGLVELKKRLGFC